MKYIALLRGVNVGGNNKVAMKSLKSCFETLRFEDVSTYINSGNVIFTHIGTNRAEITKMCEKAINNQFGLRVACCVITGAELTDAINNAPNWWDKEKTAKQNAVFVIPPKTTEEIMREFGGVKHEYEQIGAYGQVIFWTAPSGIFSRAEYRSLIDTKAYSYVTIRNANTTKKLISLL